MSERIFLGWSEPILPLAARFLADRYQRDGVLDLRGACLVVPGGRAGRRLKELLLDVAIARGVAMVPPTVVSTRDVPELFYTPQGWLGDGFHLRQAWAAALRDSDPEVIAGLFGDAPEAGDVAGWNRLASRIASIHRDVAGGGFDFRSVAELCARSTDLLFDDSDRWRLLAGVEATYRERLAATGVTDANLERIAALGRGDFRTDLDVWLVGIAELPPVTARMVARAPGPIVALVHAPESEAGGFDAVGLVVPPAWLDRNLQVPADAVRVAARPSDQAAAALDALAELGDARTGDVVVSAADRSLVPYLREWIEATGLAVHYGGGKSLSVTRPYRLLKALADYLGGGEWETFAALMRHPDFATWAGAQPGFDLALGSTDPHDRLDRLDRLFTRHLPGRPGNTRNSGGGTRVDTLVRALESSAPLRALSASARQPLSAWASPILGLVADVYAAARLDRRDPASRHVVAALDGIRKAALALDRLPPELSPGCDAASAIQVLLEEVRSGNVAEDADGTPVELVGWLEAVMDDAPHLIVVGVNEGILPESTNADAFLPDHLRGRLGIPDNATRYARDAYHLAAQLASRASVCLISGRLGASGDPLRPSRLLLTERGETLARRVLSFAKGEVNGSGREAPILVRAGTRSAFAQPPEPELRFDPPGSLRVTDFRALIADPYRFVLERVLRLESIDDAARELDPLAFGNLAHAVLQGFGASADRDSTDADLIATCLLAVLDEEVQARYPDSFPAVPFQLDHLRARLGRFARWQADRAASGWRIAVVEGKTSFAAGGEDGDQGAGGATECLFDVDGESIQLTGRIDRVDHHPATGRWALLDYKTGDAVSPPGKTHQAKDGWIDLQLPLYRHLAASLLAPDGSPLIAQGASVEFGYVALPRALDDVGGLMVEWSEEDLGSADETAREVVRRLRTGVVRFVGAKSGYGSYDPFAALLGTRLLVAARGGDGAGEGVDE